MPFSDTEYTSLIGEKISKADLRKIISRSLTASELDNFCCVCFPDVFRNFSNGMQVIQRQTLLLESKESVEVFNSLYEYVPEKVEDAIGELAYLASDQFTAISDRMQRLCKEKDILERRILDLKLQQRRGEQILTRETLSAGRYILLEVLAVGPTASAWRAIDKVRSQDVIVRILQSRFSKDQKRITQFYLNHWCQAELRHPNIARIIQEPEEDNGIYYSVIEFARRGDLEKNINSNWISKLAGLNILEQVSRALDFCHKQKICHLDIKPTNVLLNSDNFSLLTDFDFSRVQTHTVSGYDPDITPRFSAPELRREDILATPQTDIYSLCMVILFVLAGKHFYENMEDGAEIFFEGLHLKEDHRKILFEASSRDPRKRPDSLTELLQAMICCYVHIDQENN